MNIQPRFLTLAQLREIHAGSESLSIDPQPLWVFAPARSWSSKPHKAVPPSMA